MTDKRYTSM